MATPEPGIILVEDSPYESALAYVALTRNASRVIQAPDLRAARRMLAAAADPVGLAILGPRAITRASGHEIRALRVPAIGIGVHFTESDDRRALAAGLRAVYRRPREWKDYLSLIGEVLAEWLTRTGSARRPARTS